MVRRFSVLLSPISQIPAAKFPVSLRREFRRNGPDSRRVFDCISRENSLQIATIPCKFPHIREFLGWRLVRTRLRPPPRIDLDFSELRASFAFTRLHDEAAA
jgi:hypothetical protein